MPLDFERITLNAIPDGDMPVFHASQFETMRPFMADLKWGTEDFVLGEDNWCTLTIRKNDDALVIIDNIDVDNNTVSCILTQQSVACIGDNFCQLKVFWGAEGDEDGCIACLNFILHVQPDPEAGGITSESEISNLTQQIEDITHEVIGEDYYNKTEVDGLISGVESQIPTKTSDLTNDSGFITSSDLTPYAKTADLATVATTGDYDDLLNKPTIPDAQIQSDWKQADNTKVDYIKNKPDIDAMIDAALLAVMPVGTESGPIATFDTEIAAPLVNVSCDIVATGGNGTPGSPIPINGYTEANITRCGVNLWDEDWEVGNIDGNGADSPANDRIRSKGYIQVNGATSIYLVIPTAVVIHKYGVDKSYLGNNYVASSGSFPIVSDVAYIRFRTDTSYGTTYNNDISINYPATDTTYHPYTDSTYTIAFGQTVYGGVLDVTRGKLQPCIEYPSYNGETLSGRWLSSEATYIEGTTPPTGSQVVSLDDYGTDIDLTPEVISAVVGTNNVFSDTNGDTTVQFKDSIQHYIDTRI